MKKSIETAVLHMIFIRHLYDLTQKELAEVIGYSLSQVKKIECGDRALSSDYLKAFCKGLYCFASYTLFGEIKASERV